MARCLLCKSEEKGGRGLGAACYFSFSRAHRKRLTWPGRRFIISAHSASYWDSIITPYMLFNCSQFSSFFFKITCPALLQRDRISLACFSTRAIFNSARVITSHFGSFLQSLHQGSCLGSFVRNGGDLEADDAM